MYSDQFCGCERLYNERVKLSARLARRSLRAAR
jgi:hypothetical protein